MIATTLTRTLIVPESFLVGMIFHLGKENHVEADSTFIHEDCHFQAVNATVLQDKNKLL